jgi:hypothetical protein
LGEWEAKHSRFDHQRKISGGTQARFGVVVGAQVLYMPESAWDVKSHVGHEGPLPGEKGPVRAMMVATVEPVIPYDRFRLAGKVQLIIAMILGMSRLKSFKGGSKNQVTVELLREAKKLLDKDVQSTMSADLSNPSKGRYARLKPVLNREGIWVVGGRMTRRNPLTELPGDDPQILLPSEHAYTRQLMTDAHIDCGHGGRDATLARFRHEHWAPQGSKVAKAVKDSCQACRLRDAKLLKQEMGMLPIDRLKSALPFNKVMLDLFGPYTIRGEVQKRVNGKAYGILFTDMFSRAVHIEVAVGYDTDSFIMALTRFSSLRGWPTTIYSDPGSQLIGADRELRGVWGGINHGSVESTSVDKGLQWIFGPADSPWHQGAVESLVKTVKRALKFGFNNQRLSAIELITICHQVANMVNERPLGSLSSTDSEINNLTPNCLLLGRSLAQNPGSWDESGSLKARSQLVGMVSKRFWEKWTEMYAPMMMVQNKWFKASRNLKPGDVVTVADRNALRGHYYLARVDKVFPGIDGKVRKVTLVYKNFRTGERIREYKGAKDVSIARSVQRVSLLVPIDDQ